MPPFRTISPLPPRLRTPGQRSRGALPLAIHAPQNLRKVASKVDCDAGGQLPTTLQKCSETITPASQFPEFEHPSPAHRQQFEGVQTLYQVGKTAPRSRQRRDRGHKVWGNSRFGNAGLKSRAATRRPDQKFPARSAGMKSVETAGSEPFCRNRRATCPR
jgi:hypothetical protein